jgi:hypothetical protein
MISSCSGSCSPWLAHHASWRSGRQATGDSRSVRQQLTAANLSSETDLTLQIKTDEGDTVTLTAQRDFDLTMINYGERYRHGTERSRLAARLASLTVSQELQLTVEGDLSEEERADIRALLDELQPDIDRFWKTGAPVELAPTPADEYESLAGFQLDLSSTQEVNLLAARSRTDTIPRSYFQGEARVGRGPQHPRHALAGGLDELTNGLRTTA